MSASTANAATLVSPANGARTSSTPTFTWNLAPGEESYALEISTNPAPGEYGGFADDNDLRWEFLREDQTAFAVGDADPLFAGTWYWHLETYDQNYNSRWTPIRSFTVPDRPPRLRSFGVHYYTCINEIRLNFRHSDNSRAQRVQWRLDFLRHRRSGRVARFSGEAAGGWGFQRFFDKPKRLRKGKTYWARLRLKDPGGHTVTSKPDKLPIRDC